MRALVTGGNGFVGRYVVKQLQARGDEVRVIGRNHYPDLEASGVACFKVDLAAQDDCAAALRGCDVVFHVAAKAGLWGDGNDFYRNNVTATQHILRSAVRAGVPKLVYTSTPSVVIGERDIAGDDESAPYLNHYLAHYPYTKSIAERFVLQQNDILTTAIRPHIVWGPGDVHIFPRLVARARAGRLRQIGDGTNKVDITYVENAAQAHIQVADALSEQAAVRGRAYFIGQAEPVNLWAFINTLLMRLDIDPVHRRLPYAVAKRLATVLEHAYQTFGVTAEPPLTRFLAFQMAHSHWFDHSAAIRDFGYNPHISTEEGLRRTVAALRSDAVAIAH